LAGPNDVWQRLSRLPAGASYDRVLDAFQEILKILATQIVRRYSPTTRKVLSSRLMPETYFITGAQGCIGSWIVKALIERGDTAWFSIAATTRAGSARS
jgi:hypothetical protein